MLMFGAQKSSPWKNMFSRFSRTAWAFLMRPSVLITSAILWIAAGSKVAASPTGSGNSVVPLLITPCSASLHQS